MTGVPWADRVRATWAWAGASWAFTLWLLVANMVVVRMTTWDGGWTIL